MRIRCKKPSVVDLWWCVMLMMAGHTSFALSLEIGLWDMVALDLWVLPLFYCLIQHDQEDGSQNGLIPPKSTDKPQCNHKNARKRQRNTLAKKPSGDERGASGIGARQNGMGNDTQDSTPEKECSWVSGRKPQAHKPDNHKGASQNAQTNLNPREGGARFPSQGGARSQTEDPNPLPNLRGEDLDERIHAGRHPPNGNQGLAV